MVTMLQCNCSILRSATRALSIAYDEALRHSGLRVSQFSLLARLDAIGETAINDLAQSMTMDRTTLGRNLRLLERDNLVRMRVGVDRRARLIDLTVAGHKALAEATPLWKEIHNRFENEFGKSRAKELRQVLGSVVEAGLALYSGDAVLAGD
ncbi:MarR family winged helix-turn-helix transcriptional regulator [Rhodoferax ferrireducens]|uniref:MarR family winged helix-turn-helix transcriptional regulator n=1 Tax=Rhodoferax ferrireducens TaxID=192843 RepID=UPI001E44C939|nr:MarR family winged helix-turn-helix transcriptional regulator [Rhodoferax ferrireducens]